MRVCVTAQGPSLDSIIDPRFGRCQYFIFVDTDTMEFEAVENPNIMSAGGAGIQSAQFVANKGVNAVITGNVGPNAFQVLQTAGVQVLTLGAPGNLTVRQAIELFKQGRLQPTISPTVSAHFGMNFPMGQGGGYRWGQLSKEEELQLLKAQENLLKTQLEIIKRRIKELEG